MQFLGFGNGQDGDLTISADTTEAPIDSSCVGTSGTNTLAVGASLAFAANQIVMVHQTRGTGAGNWELVQVDTYVGTTLTLKSNLVNSYASSGADAAQVRVVPQYSSIRVNFGFTYSAKAWNGSVGGILFVMCNGLVYNLGTISAKGKGFRGGSGTVGGSVIGKQGEGTAGAGSSSTAANGNGGGGGTYIVDAAQTPSGGGHASAGGNGASSTGGSAVGTAALTTIFLGGGGGEGGLSQAVSGTAAVSGGPGGGIIAIFTDTLNNAGTITVNGDAGFNVNNGFLGPGGGGAAGSLMVRTKNGTLGTGTMTATGGIGGTNGSGVSPAGAGSDGRNRIEACTYTGSMSPAESAVSGGHAWCLVPGSVI